MTEADESPPTADCAVPVRSSHASAQGRFETIAVSGGPGASTVAAGPSSITVGSCNTLLRPFPGIKAWWSMKSAGHVKLPKSTARKGAKKRAAKSPVGSQPKLALDAAAKNAAIATELAPAVAIALLEKSEQLPGKPPPALDVLAVGVAPSETDGNVRIQLLFENGSVLPVEMSEAAGSALSNALSDELPTAKKQPSKRKA